MLKIPQQQVFNRWNSLPDNLKEALCSEQNADSLWKICENQHIPKEKIYTIATLTGDVILGFLHPEDLAKEIKESLNLNSEIANAIANEIDRKIFSPIRSDLEKVYAPPTAEPEKPIVTEIKKPMREAVERSSAEPALPSMEAPAEAPKIVSTEEKPKEEIKPPMETKEAEPSKVALKEPEAEVKEMGPVIIHQEAEFKPLAGAKKSLGGLFGFLKKKEEVKKKKEEPVIAKIEIGKEEEEKKKEEEGGKEKEEKRKEERLIEERLPEAAPQPKVRVVNYTEIPSPITPIEQIREEKREMEKKEEIKPIKPPEPVKPVESAAVSPVEPPKSIEIPKVEEKKEEPKKEPEEEIIDLTTLG